MLCRYFQQGACRFGDQCRYSHDSAPFGKGVASAPAHGDDRPVCQFFLAGNCSFGESCRNAHAWSGFGKKGGKKGKKGFDGKGGAKGQGSGKFQHGFAEDWPAGKGPGKHGPQRPGIAGGMGGLGGHDGGYGTRELTGPYLGKGSELRKVWMMPDDMGHEDGVRAATVMGDRVCSGGMDFRLLVWRGEQPPGGSLAFAQDNEVNFPAPVTALLFHAGSKWLFCGLSSGEIVAFRQEPSAEVKLLGHTAGVMALLIHEDVLLSGSMDGTMRAWKFDATSSTFQCAATIPCSLGAVFALQVHKGLAWLGAERGISCLKLENLEPAGQLPSAPAAPAPTAAAAAGGGAGGAPPRVVALLVYEGRVLAVFSDGVVKVFGDSGEEYSHGPLGEHTTNTAAALMRHPHAGKDLLLCGQELGYVTVYELPAFKPSGTFTTGWEGDVTAIVDMGADGVFATFGLSGDVVLWRWEREG